MTDFKWERGPMFSSAAVPAQGRAKDPTPLGS